jgi:hypothetical protein
MGGSARSDSNRGAARELDVTVKELRAAIDELATRLEAPEIANPASRRCRHRRGRGRRGCS